MLSNGMSALLGRHLALKKNCLIIKLFKLNFNYLETHQYKFFLKKQVFNLNIEVVNAYESLQLLLAKVSLFLTCKNTV